MLEDLVITAETSTTDLHGLLPTVPTDTNKNNLYWKGEVSLLETLYMALWQGVYHLGKEKQDKWLVKMLLQKMLNTCILSTCLKVLNNNSEMKHTRTATSQML